MAAGLRKPGEFCWINMLTPQPTLARDFFGKLLDWKYSDIPGMGHSIEVDGKSIGGLFDLNGPNTPPGLPPMIGVMVKVESADAMFDKVKALGGNAQPPFDVMDSGRMTVCFDPLGAQFDVWEPKKQKGTEVDSTLHGAPSWFETLTSDADRATEFYTSLFGWTPQVNQMPGFSYTTFMLGAEPVAGMMQITPDMGPLPPHWGVYFTVNNADETAKLATELGASLCIPPQDIPEIGRFCGITSPQGVIFYVIQYISA